MVPQKVKQGSERSRNKKEKALFDIIYERSLILKMLIQHIKYKYFKLSDASYRVELSYLFHQQQQHQDPDKSSALNPFQVIELRSG